MKRLIISLVAYAVLCLNLAPTLALVENKIIPSKGGDYELFGYSVDLDGNHAIVGAPGRGDIAGNAGSAFIYERKGGKWIEQIKLTKSSGKEWDLFGHSVSISGEYAIVGVPGDDLRLHIDNGSAFIYMRDGENWTEQAKLIASDSPSGAQFGYSVAIDGNYAIIGAAHDGNSKGSAYIFERNDTNWIQRAKLTGSSGLKSGHFGYSVAIDGDYAVVGEPDYTTNGTGFAYIFMRKGTKWSQQTKLVASNGEEFDLFGGSVSIDGHNAVVGAPGHSPKDPFSHRAGVGYVFQRAGARWPQQAILRGIEPGLDIPNYAVGTSVSISGSSVILGAPASYGPDVPEDKRTGAAYLYSGTGSKWTGVQKLAPRDGIDEDWFGGAVAIDGDCTIIGAHLSDPLGIESGSVYIYGKGAGQ